MSPVTAEKLGITHKIMSRGGEHGQVRSSVVDIELSNSKVTAAAWVMPGQADGVVVLPLGYGRKKAGYTGSNKGFNAYAVRTSDALWTASGGKVTVTSDDYPIACTQYHHNVEGRKILSTATLEEYKKNPDFAHEHDETPPRDLTLYKDYEKDYPQLKFYQGYKWAMAIDTTKCNGCNACVVACQSENNIPVVGKDQVMRGREMHWIRIDRYYDTGLKTQEDTPAENPELANPQTFFQPVPCQQCENVASRGIRDGEIVTACEQACPSEAIVFGDANNPNNRVSKLRAQQRNYNLLGELNARPRTTYLGAVRNPHPDLAGPEKKEPA